MIGICSGKKYQISFKEKKINISDSIKDKIGLIRYICNRKIFYLFHHMHVNKAITMNL